MAQYAKLDIMKREQPGSQAAKAMRKEGNIPANFYYAGEENVNLAIDKKVFRKAIHSGHHIFEVDINGKTQYVMIKDIQYHPVSDEIIHIDLMRVRRDEKITISVPIVFEGTAKGVKEGGILTYNLSNLEIKCLPSDVPDKIVIDVTDFEMNHVMTVNEIVVGDKIEIITDEDLDVLAVIPPKEESLIPDIPTEEEMAEAEGAEEKVGEEEQAEEESVEEAKG
ncbi:50S ribosomal protein L25 [bacterium]|nr:50S ribosomal protein L25 [bacterium]